MLDKQVISKNRKKKKTHSKLSSIATLSFISTLQFQFLRGGPYSIFFLIILISLTLIFSHEILTLKAMNVDQQKPSSSQENCVLSR